jgi:ABC-type oligopeptide transport system substrate-binding subunit
MTFFSKRFCQFYFLPWTIALTFLTCAHASSQEDQVKAIPKPKNFMSIYGQAPEEKKFTHFKIHNPNAPKEGELRIPVVGTFFDTLNPFLPGTVCAAGLGVGGYLTFDSLMQKSADDPTIYRPRLAKMVELAPDHTWVTFTLDERARFHDGTPVTSNDIKSTFEKLGKEGLPTHRMFHKRIASIELISPYKVRFTFNKTPDGSIDREAPFVVAIRPILSAKDLEGKAFSKTGLKPLLGSGPYQVALVKPGQYITFKRNPNYWGRNLPALQGMYNFDLITYDYFSNRVSAFEAFKSHLVDVWNEPDPLGWSQNLDFPAVSKGDVIKMEVPFTDAAIVTLLMFNTSRPFLKDIRVRQALSILYDVHWINKNLHANQLSPGCSYFGQTHFAAKGRPSPKQQALLNKLTNSPAAAFNKLPTCHPKMTLRERIRKAHRLLKEAGYIVCNNKIIQKKTAKPLILECIFTDTKVDKLLIPYQRNLKKAGITLHLKKMDSAQYQRSLDTRSYDMMVRTQGTGPSPGNEQKLYYMSVFAHVPSRNYAAIESAAIDGATDHVVLASTPAALKVACRVLDRLLRVGFYAIPIEEKRVHRIAFWRPLQHPMFNGISFPSLFCWWCAKERKNQK